MNAELVQDIALLILEQGAEWPSWATGLRLRASNSAVEAQLDGEPMESFQRRVFARMAEIERKGMRLRAAGYACALEGRGRERARREIAHRLLLQLEPNAKAELILAGGTWETTGVEGEERSRLIQLWSELSALQTGRTLSIRFEDTLIESGVFRAAGHLHRAVPLSGSPAAVTDPHETANDSATN